MARVEKFVGVPVVGTVGGDGVLELTDAGRALFLDDERVDLTAEARDPDQPATEADRNRLDACRLDDYADAIMSAVNTIDGIAEHRSNVHKIFLRVACCDMRAAAIRMYGIACELRRD